MTTMYCAPAVLAPFFACSVLPFITHQVSLFPVFPVSHISVPLYTRDAHLVLLCLRRRPAPSPLHKLRYHPHPSPRPRPPQARAPDPTDSSPLTKRVRVSRRSPATGARAPASSAVHAALTPTLSLLAPAAPLLPPTPHHTQGSARPAQLSKRAAARGRVGVRRLCSLLHVTTVRRRPHPGSPPEFASGPRLRTLAGRPPPHPHCLSRRSVQSSRAA